MSGIFDGITYPIREKTSGYIKTLVPKRRVSLDYFGVNQNLDFYISPTEEKTHGAIEGKEGSLDRVSLYEFRRSVEGIYERARNHK